MLRYIIDFDATLAYYERGWSKNLGVEFFGDPIPGAKEFVDNLCKHVGNDGKHPYIVIYTRRMSEIDESRRPSLKKALAAWLNKHSFYWNEIYDSYGKPDGTAFIDDRAVQCRPLENANAYKDAEAYIKNVILTYR